MKYYTISRRIFYQGSVTAFSSQLDDSVSIDRVLTTEGHWSSQKNTSLNQEFFIIDYAETVPVDYIEITPSPTGKHAFPSDFRLEASIDGREWKVLKTERKYELEDNGIYTATLPLFPARFIKLLIVKPRKTGTKYFAEIGRFSVGIRGIDSVEVSSHSSYDHNASKLLDGDHSTYWEADFKTGTSRESVNLDLGDVFYINRLGIRSASTSPHGFPESFYIEASTDRKLWTPLFEEKGFYAEASTLYQWEVAPTPARYVRMEMNSVALNNKNYSLRLSEISICGAPAVGAHTHNIGDLTPQASVFLPGVVKLAKDGEDSRGTVVQASDRRLRDASTIFKGIVQLSEDKEETPGMAVQASDSRIKPATELKPGIVRLAYDRENTPGAVIQSTDSRLGEATEQSFGIVKLCQDGVYSAMTVVQGNDRRLHRADTSSHGICRLAENGETSPGCVVQGGDRRLKDATTVSKGIVELAEDGEDTAGVAVQGHDRRLKDATTVSKGIVELAENGEDAAGLAVQGNDRRLKDATEEQKGILRFAADCEVSALSAVQGNDRRLRNATTVSKGIVELAEDGEDAAGVAVQGNDRRLKDATTMSKGIVELAEDGEDAAGVVVQGNDRRLRKAGTDTFGIIRLARDGEERSDVVVQGSDRRLKEATIVSKGIVELAEDGEDAAGVAVQGSDRRLRNATTVSKGIVELAEDGEDAAGVAVQGNDRRLRNATMQNPGIMRFAGNGEEKADAAVRADDARLSDPRVPLPHAHEYAPVVHSYDSHTGCISINADRSEKFSGIVSPPDHAAVIYGKNNSQDQGAVGIAGVADGSKDGSVGYGVLGYGSMVGMRGQSAGRSENGPAGCGVMGISRFGPGGVFSSEHSYSLVVDGDGSGLRDIDDTLNLIGNGDALSVRGRSVFSGRITLDNMVQGNDFPANMVELFEVDETEYIHAGDLLVASEKGKSMLARAVRAYSRSVVGIVSGNPALVMKNYAGEKAYPVVTGGRALCKVDARYRPIRPGDMIVTSDTPGCGMAGIMDSFEKIGTVIGKALDGLDDGIGVIPVFVVHL